MVFFLVYVGYFYFPIAIRHIFSNYYDCFSTCTIAKPPPPKCLCSHISGGPTPEKQHPDTYRLCVTIP